MLFPAASWRARLAARSSATSHARALPGLPGLRYTGAAYRIDRRRSSIRQLAEKQRWLVEKLETAQKT